MVEKSPKWWRSYRNGGEVTGISARIFDMVEKLPKWWSIHRNGGEVTEIVTGVIQIH